MLAVGLFSFPPSPPSLNMCRYRRVQRSYTTCGHVWDQPEEEIQCDNPLCRFSSTHPPNCVPPSCNHSCWQYRQFPEQYNRQIDGYCPSCSQQGRR